MGLMDDPDLWDDSKWVLKPQFTRQDADRGGELLQAVFDALVEVKAEGFTREQTRKFLRDCIQEIY